ncbi:MAG: hypothetical protein AABY40_04625 [Nanoarchaeota archaeon]
MQKIIITKNKSLGDSNFSYTIRHQGEDYEKELGWTRVLGPAEGHYAICLESNYTEGAVSGRTIGLLGIAHSKEELSDKTYRLAKDYAIAYAETMRKYGHDTEIVDTTKGTCDDLTSKL